MQGGVVSAATLSGSGRRQSPTVWAAFGAEGPAFPAKLPGAGKATGRAPASRRSRGPASGQTATSALPPPGAQEQEDPAPITLTGSPGGAASPAGSSTLSPAAMPHVTAGQLLNAGGAAVLQLTAPPALAAAAGGALAVAPGDIPALNGRDSDLLSVGSLEFPGELLLPSAAASVADSAPSPGGPRCASLEGGPDHTTPAGDHGFAAGAAATDSPALPSGAAPAEEPQLKLSQAHSGTSPVVWRRPQRDAASAAGAQQAPAPTEGLGMFALRPPQLAEPCGGDPGGRQLAPLAAVAGLEDSGQHRTSGAPEGPLPPSSVAPMASNASGDPMKRCNSGRHLSPVRTQPSRRPGDGAAPVSSGVPPSDSAHQPPPVAPPAEAQHTPPTAGPAGAALGDSPMQPGSAAVESPSRSRTERLAGRLHPRCVIARVADVLNLHRCASAMPAPQPCLRPSTTTAPRCVRTIRPYAPHGRLAAAAAIQQRASAASLPGSHVTAAARQLGVLPPHDVMWLGARTGRAAAWAATEAGRWAAGAAAPPCRPAWSAATAPTAAAHLPAVVLAV